MFFWEQADPGPASSATAPVVTAALPPAPLPRDIGSIASVGFGLTGMCIAAEAWLAAAGSDRSAGIARRWNSSPGRVRHEHGWILSLRQPAHRCARVAEQSSRPSTPPLLGGVLTVRRCFDANRDIVRLSEAIYRRVDLHVDALNGSSGILSHGWKPESGFLGGDGITTASS